jgi:enoyl-CoA hydratase/carnithine racemase
VNGGAKIILEHLEGGVARIVLSNPPLNLTTVAMMQELERAVMDVAEDNEVRVVIITGSGERAFCVGSDINEFPQIRDNFVEKKLRRENAVFSRIEAMSKPVIAALNGMTLGGGCELALACDFRVMDERAKIGQPEIKLGTFPGSGGVFRLPRIVGAARAMELLCFGTALTAREALDMGLITRIAPAGTAADVAYALAYELSKQARFAISCIKKTVHAAPRQTTAEAVQMSLDCSEQVFKTADCAEGTRAFLEKRKPRFAGAPEDDNP